MSGAENAGTSSGSSATVCVVGDAGRANAVPLRTDTVGSTTGECTSFSAESEPPARPPVELHDTSPGTKKGGSQLARRGDDNATHATQPPCIAATTKDAPL